MRVLVFQNYPCEDAAEAGAAFQQLGHELRVIDCYGGDPAPSHGAGDILLVLGGPMNVYEEDRYPFLRWETEWIGQWVRSGRPMLGLCLGAQLLSKAMGGRVWKNDSPEIGHFEVTLTEAGRNDPLFRGLPRALPVVQWHGDTFSIPEGGVHLAHSPLCANQAVRVQAAVGLQFHLEIGREKMAEWMREYISDLLESGVDVAGILHAFNQREEKLKSLCHQLIRNFCERNDES